ncbi:MAG: hypothetical protein Q4C01_05885 [Clostridia bacterium]|nr:hypothetical protein [Clostridia bacterium]
MEAERKRNKGLRRKFIILAAAAALLIAGAAVFFGLYSIIGGKVYKRSTEILTAEGSPPPAEKLGSLTELRLLDLRGCEGVDYEYVQAAEAALPEGCEIVWSVQLGCGSFDSDSTELTLPSVSAEDVDKLTYFKGLLFVDASGCSDYKTLFAAQTSYPEVEFYYTLTVGSAVLGSFDSALVVGGTPNLEQLQAALFAFPLLSEIDFTEAEVDALEITAFADSNPQLELNYLLQIGELFFDPQAEQINLSGANLKSAEEAVSFLNCFSNLKGCNLLDSGLTPSQAEQVALSCPNLTVRRQIELCGLLFDSESQSVDLRGAEVKSDELEEKLGSFSNLETLYLPDAALTYEELLPIIIAHPQVFIAVKLNFCGQEVSSETAELDISGYAVEDFDGFYAQLQAFPRLERLVMCGCGLENERMEQLMEGYPETRFVWTVSIGPHEVRTDAIGFSTKNPTKYTSDKATDEYNELVKKTVRLYEGDIEALKYCTDLVALDLGHNYLTNADLEVLKYLPKLQILILADNKITDISALASLHELVYVELFMNRIPDVSPLTGLEKLLDVNICNIGLSDLTPLYELKSVERLFYAMNEFSRAEGKALADALPSCECNYTTTDETGDGWREHPRYFWMREFFKD